MSDKQIVITVLLIIAGGLVSAYVLKPLITQMVNEIM